jgi:Amt family ammonium transporter
MILCTGYGFNPGSALLLTEAESKGTVAALAAVNTTLSAASSAISALFTQYYLMKRQTGECSLNLSAAMNGCLAGLVAVTASCGTIENWAAVCVGIVAGWIYLAGSHLLITLKIDDAINAIPVHMFNGMWGLIATGLFSSPGRMRYAFGTDEHVGLIYSPGQGSFDGTLLLIQFMALLFVVGWSAGMMLPFFVGLNYLGWFRTDSLEELVGLDNTYHGGVLKKGEIKAIQNTLRKRAARQKKAAAKEDQSDEEEGEDDMPKV